MNTTLPVRPKFDTRLSLVITRGEKRELFEAAAARNMTASELIREAALAVVREGRAA